MRAPRSLQAGAALEAEAELLTSLQLYADTGVLSFAVPRISGTALLPEGGRAVVHPALDGTTLDVDALRPGPGLAADLGRVLASIHELPRTIVDDAGLPGYDVEEYRARRMAELDEAAPRHAVYISGTGGGTGALTNSRGRAFFSARGVAVDAATGVVASAGAAVAALQAAQTPDDKLRGTAALNAHANSLGLTAVVNAGNLPDQEFALRLWRDDKLTVRMRPLFPADSPAEVEARVLNNFSQGGRAVGDVPGRAAGNQASDVGGGRTQGQAHAEFPPPGRDHPVDHREEPGRRERDGN